MEQSYNGWSNRETWAVVLHLDSDQVLHEQALELVNDYADSSELFPMFRGWVETLVSRGDYEDEFGGKWPEGLERMASDVGSVWRVDWSEVIEHYQQIAKEV